MTVDEVATLFAGEGLYICGDKRLPGTTMPVLVLSEKAPCGLRMRGRAFMWTNTENNELTPDAELWNNGQTFLAGGPYNIRTCKEHAADQEELATLRETMADTRRHLLTLRDGCLRAGFLHIAETAQQMLDNIWVRMAPYEFQNKVKEHE